jgi:amphiphysin
MLKGAKKAIVRTPHRLIGSKSTEDRIIIEWTKDFTVAEAALDLIAAEAKKLVGAWKDILSSQKAVVQVLVELYEPIQEDNVYKAPQETPQSATNAVKGLDATMKTIGAELEPIIVELETSFAEKCKSAKQCLDSVQKALKKRERKKVDFDRYSNSVDKQAKKQNMTDKDHTYLAKLEGELDQALELFQNQDEKVKSHVPYILNSLSEFLNALTTLLYLSQQKAFEIFKTQLFSYAQSQGLLVGHNEPPSYLQIADDWESRYITIQPQAEEGIKTIQQGKTVGTPMTLPSRKRDKAVNLVGQTGDFAHKIYQRAKHPSVAHIQFSSPSQGMFRSEANILTVGSAPNSPSSQVHRSSSTSSGALGARTPITSTPEYIDDTVKTRVRALSSSSARALSPASIKTPQNKVLIPPKSDNDEYAIALYTFAGDVPGDVAFRLGDKIRVLDHGDEVDDMWWFGETADGRVGLFPCNYVELQKMETVEL